MLRIKLGVLRKVTCRNFLDASVNKYRVPKIDRPITHRNLCQIVIYAPMLFVKVTLYSVDVYGKRTLSYGELPMFLHR